MSPPSSLPPLCLIVQSGAFAQVHYALTLASAAAAINRPSVLFFTLAACRALTQSDTGTPGWHSLNGASLDADYGDKGLPQFESLLATCKDLGVTIMVCEMGLKAETLSQQDLRPDIPIEAGGIVTFLNRAGSSGQIIAL